MANRKPVTTAQVKRVITAHLEKMRRDRLILSPGRSNPQVAEMLTRIDGEISALEDVAQMIADRIEKPYCW